MSHTIFSRALIPLSSGILFGLGLAVSGMTDTNKVLGFLNLFGQWDPALAFVMGAGLLIAIPGFYFLKKRKKPIWAGAFSLPEKTTIDRPLIIGSALFGVGWGLYGWCPGPALASFSLTFLSPSIAFDALLFTAAMILGMLLSQRLQQLL